MLTRKSYKITSKIFVYQGVNAWRFLGIPKPIGTEIKEKFGKNSRGWGSLPVYVTISKTTWKTSIFPDKKSGTYLLPLKLKIRKMEDIYDDDTVTFSITLL